MIYWLPCNSPQAASSRFYAYWPHKLLAIHGFPTALLRQPNRRLHDLTEIEGACLEWAARKASIEDVYIFQKVWGPRGLVLADKLRKAGNIVVYAASDSRRDLEMARAANACVASSTAIANRLRNVNPDVAIAPEPVDCWVQPRERRFEDKSLLRVCWIGGEANQEHLLSRFKAEASGFPRSQLKVISIGRNADAKYEFSRLAILTADCDAFLVTASVNSECSPNRIAQGWALGLPVILEGAHPYSHLVMNGIDAVVIRDLCDLASACELLRAGLLRRGLAEAGFKRAQEAFADDTVARWWVEFFRERGWIGHCTNRRQALPLRILRAVSQLRTSWLTDMQFWRRGDNQERFATSL